MIPIWLGVVGVALSLFLGSMRAPRRRPLALVDDTARFRALRSTRV